ncbi:MAG: class I SAM-dependent methyltransferase, partial [Actinobacteria bacterium]|nr:class I SAM-dependent methyltransferase [Actinomycetota bacterium]
MTSAPAPTTYAPDGSPVEAFARLPAGPAPDLLDQVLPPAATVLDLGCGAGRIAHPLHQRGHRVTAVDQCPDMLRHVDPAIETHLADIETLDLGRRFDAVLLASFLVNTVDHHQRRKFLVTCARHLAPTGALYLQRLDPELVPIAVDAESEEAGVVYAMHDVHHGHGDGDGDGDQRFEATMRFTIGGLDYSHRYAGEVLDDDALAQALAPHGLRVARFLDGQRSWVEARP